MSCYLRCVGEVRVWFGGRDVDTSLRMGFGLRVLESGMENERERWLYAGNCVSGEMGWNGTCIISFQMERDEWSCRDLDLFTTRALTSLPKVFTYSKIRIKILLHIVIPPLSDGNRHRSAIHVYKISKISLQASGPAGGQHRWV